MKTLLIAICLGTTFMATARNNADYSKMTLKLKTSFLARFADAENVVWKEAMNNMSRAEFVLDDEKMSAYFDEDGTFVAQTREISQRKLPKNLQASLKEKAPGAEVVNVFEMQSDEETAWFVETVANNEHKVWKGNAAGKLSRYYVKQ